MPELAAALGVSRQTVISIENGRYLPSLPLAFRIARFFDLTEDKMIDPDIGTKRRMHSANLAPHRTKDWMLFRPNTVTNNIQSFPGVTGGTEGQERGPGGHPVVVGFAVGVKPMWGWS